MDKYLIVIGGGAAGFFCAVNAARMNPALRVTLLEKSDKLLAKVKVSGGGRCNVTHACFDHAAMSRHYPRGQHFVRKAFHQFFTTNTIQWFEERGVKLKTEDDGRMFPVSDSSQSIIDCLLKEAGRYGVQIMMKAELTQLHKTNGLFRVELADKRQMTADVVCIAAGGYPKSGMFDWIRSAGHTIEEPVPSLFTFNLPGHAITRLMGISVENARVKIRAAKLEEEGPLLITHWGLSGPVVLRLSAWGARELAANQWQFGISINWLPAYNEQTLRERMQQLRQAQAAQRVTGKNNFGLPNRLWEFLLEEAGINETMRWAELPAALQNKLVKLLCQYEAEVRGKTTFKEEFVTAGGVSLREVDPQTMMSKKVERLYFAGEVLDVDGITGGFNFQNAWTTGFVAAQHIAHITVL